MGCKIMRVRIHQPFFKKFFFLFSKYLNAQLEICKLEYNTNSDWLNHTLPIISCVIFQFANLGEKDKEWSCEWFVNTGPGLCGKG